MKMQQVSTMSKQNYTTLYSLKFKFQMLNN